MNDEKYQAAFPIAHSGNTWETGMTIRDYFAAKALQGLLATDALEKGGEFVSPEENERLLAETCYCIADAMLKYRES